MDTSKQSTGFARQFARQVEVALGLGPSTRQRVGVPALTQGRHCGWHVAHRSGELRRLLQHDGALIIEPPLGADQAVPELVDALREQLGTATGRTFTEAERDEIRTHQQRAYRWTFLVSGLRHPNFVRIVDQVTTTGPDKIATAAQALSA